MKYIIQEPDLVVSTSLLIYSDAWLLAVR